MWTAKDYLCDGSEGPGWVLAEGAGRITDAAWRMDLSAPGFAVLELGAGVDSASMRSLMVDLKGRLGEIIGRRGGGMLVYRSVGRFDQQVTTKFHLDGAPERSLLVLGYEPSKVRSRLSLADLARCSFDLGIEPRRFLDEFNPMYRKGEELLAPYVTELPGAAEGHGRIVLINNSSLPFAEGRDHPLGVLHKAEILDPDDSEARVVNSMMLAVGGSEEVGGGRLREFVTTREVSRKFSG